MTRNTPTTTQMSASQEAFLELLRIKSEMEDAHERGLVVPSGWSKIDADPAEPAKTRITLRVDADVVAWFRRLGPRYQSRMNRVLRLFMLNAISGELSGKWERGWNGELRRKG